MMVLISYSETERIDSFLKCVLERFLIVQIKKGRWLNSERDWNTFLLSRSKRSAAFIAEGSEGWVGADRSG